MDTNTSTPTGTSGNTDGWHRPEAVAERLGVSVRTAYRYIKNGTLHPVEYIGDRHSAHVSDATLNEFIARRQGKGETS